MTRDNQDSQNPQDFDEEPKFDGQAWQNPPMSPPQKPPTIVRLNSEDPSNWRQVAEESAEIWAQKMRQVFEHHAEANRSEKKGYWQSLVARLLEQEDSFANRVGVLAPSWQTRAAAARTVKSHELLFLLSDPHVRVREAAVQRCLRSPALTAILMTLEISPLTLEVPGSLETPWAANALVKWAAGEKDAAPAPASAAATKKPLWDRLRVIGLAIRKRAGAGVPTAPRSRDL